jgi:hypothetical protein
MIAELTKPGDQWDERPARLIIVHGRKKIPAALATEQVGGYYRLNLFRQTAHVRSHFLAIALHHAVRRSAEH